MNSVVSIPFRIRASWLILSIGIGTSIAVLTLMPQSQMPKAPQGLDKLYHALAFAGLVLPTGVLRPDRRRIAVPLAVAYGALIELVQSQVGRSAEFADLLADGLGVMAGIAISIALRRVLFERPGAQRR